MMNLKRIICAFLSALMLCTSTAFASVIPDHCGTDLEQFEVGTKKLGQNVLKYKDLFKAAGEQFGVDPNILAAICMQESGGINYDTYADGTDRPAKGIMQIEYTNEKSFANFGYDQTGVEWTLDDRLDPEKAIPYAAWLISEILYRYNNDYAKTLQAYNFGEYMMNMIIKAKGDDWLEERGNAKSYISGWSYSSYGDKEYIEHVLRYFHKGSIPYNGAKVKLNGKYLKFSNQYPLVVNNRTLIPIRAISEALGAKVSWDGNSACATIKKDGKTIELFIDSEDAYINDEPYVLDVPASLINNRTMVPIRFVAEALGTEVEWDQDTCTVEIFY